MGLWVLDGNRAEQFYQRMGAIPLSEKPLTIGGAVYVERAYALFDLAE